MRGLRVFSTRLPPGARRIYQLVVIYFLVVSAALLWPIYPLFSRARPIVFGLPLSLFYLAALLIASFGVLVALYLWEVRRGRVDEGD